MSSQDNIGFQLHTRTLLRLSELSDLGWVYVTNHITRVSNCHNMSAYTKEDAWVLPFSYRTLDKRKWVRNLGDTFQVLLMRIKWIKRKVKAWGKFLNWCAKILYPWTLTFKTKLLYFCHHTPLFWPSISMNDANLKRNNPLHLLGNTFSTDLK